MKIAKMKQATLLLSLLMIFTVSECVPFYGYRLRPFYRYRIKMERIGPGKNVLPADIKQSKSLGPNVCVKRVPIGMQTRCHFINNKYNCTMVSQYRSVFNCCPGFRTSHGKSGCPTEMYTSDKNIMQMAESLGLHTLASLLEISGLNKTLSKTTERFTLFAPSEKAFRSLGKSMTKRLTTDKKILTRLLLDHVVSGKIPGSNMEDNKALETLNAKNRIRFNCYYRCQVLTINGVRIMRANVGASNGIIHVVDAVLIPPKLTAMELLEKNKDTSLFRKALYMSNIKISDGETIFAPTNKAFNNMDANLFERLLKSPKCLKNLLLNHILPDTVFSQIVADEGEYYGVRTKEGTAYYMKRSNHTILINKAGILRHDINAKDAVIQVIDTVLIPTSALTIMEIARQKGAVMFTRLIKELGLKALLSEDKKFTLFAPTDDALRGFFKDSSERVLGNISEVIKYHIVPRSLQTCDFMDDMYLETLAGDKKIRVNVYDYGKVTSVQGVCLSNKECNTEGCNGAVHIISRPLVAPTTNIRTIIEMDPRFTAFSAALKKANLFSMLNQSNSITILAPTNAAFSKVSPKKLEALLADQSKLCDLLKYHFIPGSLFPCALDGVCPVTSINGHNLLLHNSQNGMLKINEKISSHKELIATNGIIYPIDQILTPRRRKMTFIQRFWRAYGGHMP